jgi:phosphate transport system permease protein
MTTTLSDPGRQAAGAPEGPPSLERTEYGDRVFRGILTLGALTIPLLLGFLVYELWQGSRLAIGRFGLGFVTTSTWDPVAEQFGAFPLIFGTLLSPIVALVISGPISPPSRSGSRSPSL